MDAHLATLAGAVVQVKRELGALDDQIRSTLVACADLQGRLAHGEDEQARLRYV